MAEENNYRGPEIDPSQDPALKAEEGSSTGGIKGNSQGKVNYTDADGYGLKYTGGGSFGTLNPNKTATTGFSPGAYPSSSSANSSSVTAGVTSALAQGGSRQATVTNSADWRVRISLADSSNYLYNIQPTGSAGILEPLRATSGVIFPYTPDISVTYSASYDQQELTHSNYKLFFYKNSSVGDVTVSGDFTAQDTGEADYVLAVMHFFRTVTKMFYGQDQNPPNGVPPPLVFLNGYGAYQFDKHPMLVTNFTMQLPSDVDYIRTSTGLPFGAKGVNLQGYSPSLNSFISPLNRLLGGNLQAGATAKPPNFSSGASSLAGNGVTYVPTKMKISITCLPVVSRNAVSNGFSVQNYASGTLLQGRILKTGAGYW